VIELILVSEPLPREGDVDHGRLGFQAADHLAKIATFLDGKTLKERGEEQFSLLYSSRDFESRAKTVQASWRKWWEGYRSGL